MRRIGLAVVLAVGLSLASLVTEAQQTEKVRRIGLLSGTSKFPEIDGLVQGLRAHGYVVGPEPAR